MPYVPNEHAAELLPRPVGLGDPLRQLLVPHERVASHALAGSTGQPDEGVRVGEVITVFLGVNGRPLHLVLRGHGGEGRDEGTKIGVVLTRRLGVYRRTQRTAQAGGRARVFWRHDRLPLVLGSTAAEERREGEGEHQAAGRHPSQGTTRRAEPARSPKATGKVKAESECEVRQFPGPTLRAGGALAGGNSAGRLGGWVLPA